MKSIFYLLIPMLLTFKSTGQNPLSPLADKIYQATNDEKNFYQASPFEQLGDTKSSQEFAGVLSDGQLLSVDLNALQSLYQSGHESLLLEIPAETKKAMTLELVRQKLLTADFIISTSGTNNAATYQPGIYYRGIVSGQPNSLVAISIFENELMGVISTREEGNMVLGKLEKKSSSDYILYSEKNLLVNSNFTCETQDPELTPDLMKMMKAVNNNPVKSASKCVRAYLECEYDMFEEKGGVNETVNFMTGLFNVVATIYQNENISTEISEIFVWNTPDSYPTASLNQAYTNFRLTRFIFDGDLALLVSRGAPSGGGIAGVNTLCNLFTHGYAYIESSYDEIPTYTWSVHVITHEMGHILGSYHTHSCVWNGNGTAIDGCAYEGCNAPIPTAGTIMSYCQSVPGVGVDFSLGFHEQPGDLIRYTVENATCLSDCAPPCPENLSYYVNQIDCPGEATGSISMNMDPNAGPYTYAWSTGAATSALYDLAAGTYTVTVASDLGCEWTEEITVKEPAALEVYPLLFPPSFPTAADGAIVLDLNGATPPYNCIWSTGSTAESLFGLDEGDYAVTIYDGMGCDEIEAFSLQAEGCEHGDLAVPFVDGFEDNLNFAVQNTEDDFDWSIYSNKTPTKQTGPKKALEGTYYLYTEASGQAAGNKAVLTSKCINLKDIPDAVLSFGYHMYGNQMGSLEVDISTDNGDTWHNEFSAAGNHRSRWRAANIDLSAYENASILIRFTGTTGGERSDMAIDAVQINYGDSEPLTGTTAEVRTLASNLVLFPNPAADVLTISFEHNLASSGTVKVIDIAGRVLREMPMEMQFGENMYGIDITELKDGMYLLSLEREGYRTLVKKFTVIR